MFAIAFLASIRAWLGKICLQNVSASNYDKKCIKNGNAKNWLVV